MRRSLSVPILVLSLSSPLVGSESGYLGPPLDSRYNGPLLIDNSQYRYTGRDMLTFSTPELLASKYPDLLPLRPAIDSWASRVGIHPRVFSAVIAAYFDGSLVRGDRLDKDAVAQLAGAMEIVFSREAPGPLAASRAAMAVSGAFGFELALDPDLAESRQHMAAPDQAPPLFGYFQPPWEIGDTWAGGGAHGNSHDALDFWGNWVAWGGDTTPYWVSAMQEGEARVWSECSISVVHPNGWTTGYYHLERIQIADRTQVQRDDRLSNYADDEATATCDGGFSSGPHVHMSLRYNGIAVSVDEANVDFTAFSLHENPEEDYDFDCPTTWYNHFTEGTVCPSWDELLNNAPDPVTIFSDGFEVGSSTFWSN